MCYDVLMPMVWKTSVEKWEIKSLQNIVDEEKMKRLGKYITLKVYSKRKALTSQCPIVTCLRLGILGVCS